MNQATSSQSTSTTEELSELRERIEGLETLVAAMLAGYTIVREEDLLDMPAESESIN